MVHVGMYEGRTTSYSNLSAVGVGTGGGESMTTGQQQQEQEPVERAKRLDWLKRISAAPIFVGMASAVVGVVVGLAIPWAAHKLSASEPPPDSIVLQIMDKEIQFAKDHRGVQALELYAPNAVVVDAGCQNPGTGFVWQGADSIRRRYETLPSFASLSHANVHVSWIPPDNSANRATVTAETVGVILPRTPIRGHEQWGFKLINGRWLITSFFYNLCFP